jgi:hypothetical protein
VIIWKDCDQFLGTPSALEADSRTAMMNSVTYWTPSLKRPRWFTQRYGTARGQRETARQRERNEPGVECRGRDAWGSKAWGRRQKADKQISTVTDETSRTQLDQCTDLRAAERPSGRQEVIIYFPSPRLCVKAPEVINKAIVGPSTQQFFSSSFDLTATTCFGHATIISGIE